MTVFYGAICVARAHQITNTVRTVAYGRESFLRNAQFAGTHKYLYIGEPVAINVTFYTSTFHMPNKVSHDTSPNHVPGQSRKEDPIIESIEPR